MGKIIAGCFGLIFMVFITVVIAAIVFSQPSPSSASLTQNPTQRVKDECNRTYGTDSFEAINCFFVWAGKTEYEYNKRKKEADNQKLEDVYRRARQ